ncbi:MAG: hypothetical protein V3S66_06430, partial [Desulfobacterales bacterium]
MGKDETEIAAKCTGLDVCFLFDVGRSMFIVIRVRGSRRTFDTISGLKYIKTFSTISSGQGGCREFEKTTS